MIKTGLKLLLWPLFSLKYILVDKMIAAVPRFCIQVNICWLNLFPSSVVHARTLSYLRLSKLELDIAFEHGNVNYFLNLVYNV